MSLAVFAVVMTIAVGALVSLIEANSRAQSLKEAVNNLNFALESMARQIRVGDTYHCGEDGPVHQPDDCLYGYPYLGIESQAGDRSDPDDQLVFARKETDDGRGYIVQSDNSGDTFARITSPSVDIEDLLFYVRGAARGRPDNEQPRVIIVLSGSVGSSGRTTVPFHLQTTVTQRLLDY